MNNLKFRAYIKSINKVVDVFKLDFKNNTLVLDIDGDEIISKPFWWYETGITRLDFEEVEIIQSTGLKDKNEKEIFEGDIVVGKFYFAGVGCFDTGEREVIVRNKPVLWEDGKFLCSGFDLSEMNECIKVIGNIYKNKELLR